MEETKFGTVYKRNIRYRRYKKVLLVDKNVE